MRVECNTKLDVGTLKQGPRQVGKLTEDVINTFGLPLSEVDIFIDRGRIKHIKKHRKDFETEEEFWNHIECIPDIISNPDYVGLHPNGESVQYIKRIDKWTLVAVRVEGEHAFTVRTTFPITQKKLEKYLNSGQIKKMK